MDSEKREELGTIAVRAGVAPLTAALMVAAARVSGASIRAVDSAVGMSAPRESVVVLFDVAFDPSAASVVAVRSSGHAVRCTGRLAGDRARGSSRSSPNSLVELTWHDRCDGPEPR